MSAFWSNACSSALGKPLQTSINDAIASCSVTIAAFCASAVGCGTMFVLWWRMSVQLRLRVWKLYGWFTWLACFGSLFGAVSWSAHMRYLELILAVLDDDMRMPRAVQYSLVSRFQSWFAAFNVTYAVEFACLSVAKLMVLRRLTDFAASNAGALSRVFVVGSRVVMALVVVGNTVGLCSNVAAGVYYQRAAERYLEASDAFAANKTADASQFLKRASEQLDLAFPTESIQEFSEVGVLIIIIAAFAVAGCVSLLRIRSAMLRANQAAAALGKELHWRIMSTVIFVFLTFLLRAVYSIMNALANQLMGNVSLVNCPSRNRCDATCFNDFRLLQMWMLFTPHFPLIIILISSPLALLVALWGMTSSSHMRLLASSVRDNASLQAMESRSLA